MPLSVRLSTAAVVVFASLAATTAAVGGVDPQWTGLTLMRPDSLEGWQYGSAPAAGWTVAAGRLRGEEGCRPLTSGFSYGDVELRFAWSVKPGGAWRLLLPAVPEGAGVEIVLCEGPDCGAATNDGKPLWAGQNVAAAAAHRATVRRAQGRMVLEVDGQTIGEAPLDPARRLGLGLAVAAGGQLWDLRAAEPPGEPIFNGRDLTGWWTPADIGAWGVDNGELIWVRRGGSYIRTERAFSNFTFRCEYKIGKGGNSGVGIRTPRLGWPSADGMELQLYDTPLSTKLDKHQTMSIYGAVPPLARYDRSGDWNSVVVKADGRMVSAWVNGELVQQYNTACHPELKYRHLAGWIGLQDHNDGVRFRNIRVLEAPPGLGLAAWNRPMEHSGGSLLVDRVMNPERLSLDDGLTTASVFVPAPRQKPPLPKPPLPKPPVKPDSQQQKPKVNPPTKSATTPAAKAPSPLKPAATPAATKPTLEKGQESAASPAAKPTTSAAAAPASKVNQGRVGQPQGSTRRASSHSARSGAERKPPAKRALPAPPPPEYLRAVEAAERAAPPRVLAELTGPGAVVRLARSSLEGELAFYFDGAAQPQLTCPADKLVEHIPCFGEEPHLVLGSIAYRRSLKIVLLHSPWSEYRIDYVRFPADLAMESWSGPEGGFPPGWLSAANFRFHQHQGGTIRSYDPLPRLLAAPQTIAPGQSRQLAENRGAGLVLWLRLLANRQILANDDLWLEATVDGAPAAAAPARFWFPGLRPGNFANFVLAERGGPTLRLAMPYARGVSFAVRNTGKTAVEVGIEASIQPLPAGDAQTRRRLRGAFLPRGAGQELAHLTGAGRLIGLVYEQPQRTTTALAGLAVDGHEQPGWTASSLGPLFGYGGKDFRRGLSGQVGGLGFAYFLLTPVDYQRELTIRVETPSVGPRLVWYYERIATESAPGSPLP